MITIESPPTGGLSLFLLVLSATLISPQFASKIIHWTSMTPKEIFGLVSSIALGIGTITRWFFVRRKRQQLQGKELQIESNNVTMEQLEKLTHKLMVFMDLRVRDAEIIFEHKIENAKSRARYDMLIQKLRTDCPNCRECLDKIIQTIDDEQKRNQSAPPQS